MKRHLLIISFIGLLITTFSCQSSKFVQKIIYENPQGFLPQTTDIDFSQELITDATVIIQIYVNTELLDAYDSTKSSFQSYLATCEDYYYQTNLQVFRSLNLTGYESYYICKYAPIIDIEYKESTFSTTQISSINSLNTTNNKISRVYIKRYNDNKVTNQLRQIVKERNLNMLDEYTNRTVTGDGVRIGIIEDGSVDKNHADFENTYVKVMPKGFLGLGTHVSDHTTNMGRLMAGTNGLACNASLYSAYLSGSPDDEVEWMLDNEVDLVNMSYSDSENPDGRYNSDTAYYDFIAKKYHLLFVVASGNWGETTGYVSNPGLGYNLLTVGATCGSYNISSYSSYKEVDGPLKPNVSTIGNSISPCDYNVHLTGTSVSCAIITGAVACMFEVHPQLKNNPEEVIATVMATATRVQNGTYDQPNGTDDKFGAGQVNYKDAVNAYNGGKLIINTEKNSGDTVYNNYFYLLPGTSIDVCIVTFVNATGNVNDRGFTDYDIILAYGTQNQVLTSQSSSYNIEYLHYTNNTDEGYVSNVYVIQDGLREYDGERTGFSERTKVEPY